MTGMPGLNFDAFNDAARQLRAEGYEVNNPAEHFDGVTDLPRTTYMREAYRSLINSDVLFVLKRWEESLGATDKVLIAQHSGIPVYRFDTRDLVEGMGCVLLDAREAVLSARAKTYGHPLVNLGCTAELWRGMFGSKVTPERVAWAQVLLKLGRHLTGQYHRDNLVDAAGYIKTAEMILGRVND